jgi:alpha-L-rhamnosidase
MELAQVLDKNPESATYQKAADLLYTAFNKQFWNERESAYNSAFVGDKIYSPTVHAQLIPLFYGLVPENRKNEVQKWFLKNYKNPGMKHCCTNPDSEKMVGMKAGIEIPVIYFWAFSELYRINTEQSDQEVIQEIRRRWTPMVNYLQKSGTLAESFINEKGKGFSEACHNYGATPAWFLSSFVLGVRREGPVWENQILIEPRLGDLSYAEGVVVTEYGPVPVCWERSNDGNSLIFNLTIPEGISATIHFPKLSDKTTLILNNKVIVNEGIPGKDVKIDDRWFILQRVTGSCNGSLIPEP